MGQVATSGLALQTAANFGSQKEMCSAANGKLGFFIIKPDCKDASGNIIPEEIQMKALIAKREKEKMQKTSLQGPTVPVQEMQRGGSKKLRRNKKKRYSNRRNKSIKNR